MSPTIWPAAGTVPANAPGLLLIPRFGASVDMDDEVLVSPEQSVVLDAEGVLRFDYAIEGEQLTVSYRERHALLDACRSEPWEAQQVAELEVGPAEELPETLGTLLWSTNYDHVPWGHPSVFSDDGRLALTPETSAGHVLIYQTLIDGDVLPVFDSFAHGPSPEPDPIALHFGGEWRARADHLIDAQAKFECDEHGNEHSVEVQVRARVLGTNHVVTTSPLTIECWELVAPLPSGCFGGEPDCDPTAAPECRDGVYYMYNLPMGVCEAEPTDDTERALGAEVEGCVASGSGPSSSLAFVLAALLAVGRRRPRRFRRSRCA